jgi:hypothetical protein
MFALHWLSYLIYPIFSLHSVWRTTFFIPIFSLGCFENFLQVHSRDDRESMSLLFCLDIVKPLSLRSGLLLSYMLGLNYLLLCVSMFFVVFLFYCFQQKKNGGEDAEFLFFLELLFRYCVFLSDILVYCALIEYAYIWLRVYVWYLRSFSVHLNSK